MSRMTTLMVVAVVAAAALVAPGAALNNGLSRTPPMGFMSWERFRCNIDCKTYPDECISENLYMAQADALVAGGYKDAGYISVDIDDCWSNHTRAADGSLQADATRFPHGIKWLADYMHERGLLMGIYTDIGTHTCGGYPGSQGHYEQDAQTFADWGIDKLKVDGCYADTSNMPTWYPEFGAALNKTGRPIVYSCSWPAYMVGKANFTDIAIYCNLWRNYDDIQDAWSSLTNIIDWWGENSAELVAASGPGAWNDPDQLIVGDFSLSPTAARTQMIMWAMLAAPLQISADLRTIADEYKAILLNKAVIAVNQDPMGRQASRVKVAGSTSWWTRPLADGSTVVAIVSYSSAGSAFVVDTSFADINFNHASATATDVWTGESMGTVTGSFSIRVNPSGAVMVKLMPN